jgi:hypothetical protein
MSMKFGRFSASLVAGAVALGFVASAQGARAETPLLPRTWVDFAAGRGVLGSLAWSGEREDISLFQFSVATQSGDPPDGQDVDPKLITGIAAPEPPAAVMAGLAIAGAFCGRSMFIRRRR